MTNKIHVLTLNWNGADKLQRLRTNLGWNLYRLFKTKDLEYTWLIRDNGSKDDSVKIANSFNIMSDSPLEVNVFEIGHNRDNFAQGMNFLFEKANPDEDDLILLLNNDVIFNDNDSLKNMYELLEKDQEISIVGARLLYTNTNKLQHAGVIFSKDYNSMPYHFKHGESTDLNAEKNRYFQAVTAAVCMIRARDFQAVGGMEEKLSWAFEDIDLNLKVKKLGKKIAYCGQTNIFHEESASLKKNPMNKLFMRQNVKIFKEKWLGKYELDHEKYLKNPDYNLVK